MSGLPSQEVRARLLIIDDDSEAASSLAATLTVNGYEAFVAGNASTAKARLQELGPDLVIMDLILRDADGLMLCADIKNTIGLPIIVCSATRRGHDRVLALRLGADDFMAKPFDIDELQARVAAVLRRSRAIAPQMADQLPPIRAGSLVVNRSRHVVAVGKQELQTTPTEYRLLCALASRPEGAFSREVLAQAVWGYDVAGVGRMIDVHVSRLKRKLRACAAKAPKIVSVRGEGYKLTLNHDNAVS